MGQYSSNAKSQYLGDKNARITLRLNQKQYSFVRSNAERMDCSPSDFLRMCINVAMVEYEKAEEKAKEVSERENEPTHLNNQL